MLGRVRRKRRVLSFLLLGFLIAVNALLILLLLRQGPVTAEPASQDLTVNPTASPSSTSTPTLNATPSNPPTRSPKSLPAEKKQPGVIPTNRLLIAESAHVAWRATVGDCKTAGKIERSTNGGESWKVAVKKSGLARIVQLGIEEAAGNLYAVGGSSQDCSARYIAYSRSGAVVAQTEGPQGVWFLNPGDSDQVFGPGNAKATPCKNQHVISLAALDNSRALVICTGGSVATTSNGGGAWKKVGSLPGTMAVTAAQSRYWAAGSAKACDGVAVRALGVAGDRLSLAKSQCAKKAKLTAGQVALGGSGKAIWLWAGDKVRVSTNGGRSWT